MIQPPNLSKLMKNQFSGFLFVLPFVIGFLFLFAAPMLTSIQYSFSDIAVDSKSIVLTPVGFKHYKFLLSDMDFLKRVLNALKDCAWRIPMIIFFSMFIAILLKDKFPGRVFFRVIMFLPVIFASDVVIGLLSKDSPITLEGSNNIYMVFTGEATGFLKDLMNGFGFPGSFLDGFMHYVNNVFGIAWDSGIQIVLFVLGLQAVPLHLYEVCTMEGATKWETFWKITFPLLSPTILLCIVYTIIDTFNSSSNPIVSAIQSNMQMKMSYACVQTWVYSIGILVIVGIVFAVMSRRTIYLE